MNKGWTKESERHSLAAHGEKTKVYGQQNTGVSYQSLKRTLPQIVEFISNSDLSKGKKELLINVFTLQFKEGGYWVHHLTESDLTEIIKIAKHYNQFAVIHLDYNHPNDQYYFEEARDALINYTTGSIDERGWILMFILDGSKHPNYMKFDKASKYIDRIRDGDLMVVNPADWEDEDEDKPSQADAYYDYCASQHLDISHR
jgi:hypothetical protein